MLVEIWSDIVCPFCYVGKQTFRSALDRFTNRDSVDVTWRSFLLHPGLDSRPGTKVEDYLSETKGWPVEKARQLNAQIAERGRLLGLNFHFDRVKVAGSFDAHRLLQFGSAQGLGQQVADRLFRAYFSEGKDISDPRVLAGVGADCGLDSGEVVDMLQSQAYAREVSRDVDEAKRLGIRAVPSFVFNRRHLVQGAQDSDAFLNVLQRAWNEHPADQSPDPQSGSVCAPEGECEEE